MRALAICAFVLDGVATVGFMAMRALGEGRMTLLDGLILLALLVGFLYAFASVALTDIPPTPTPLPGPSEDLERHLAILAQPSIDVQ